MARKWIWKKWWVALWALVVAVVPSLAFVLPPFQWALLAGGVFGGMEGFALWDGARRIKDRQRRFLAPYPPLTYVARYYLPRWLVYLLSGALVGGIGVSVSANFPPEVRGATILGLFSWLVEHWEITFRDIPKPT